MALARSPAPGSRPGPGSAVGGSPAAVETAPKVNAFRGFCQQLTEQLCLEFEREVQQLTEDVVRYRAELARCADLLAYQLGKEKQYHSMLESIAGNTSMLMGKASEVGNKANMSDPLIKQQMHQMLDQVLHGQTGALAENLGGIDEHRRLAESHLMKSSELQNQSEAVQKELENILQALNMPPVAYTQAPMIRPPAPAPGAPVLRPMAGCQMTPPMPPFPQYCQVHPLGAPGMPVMQPAPGVRPIGMVPQPASLFDGNTGAPGMPPVSPGGASASAVLARNAVAVESAKAADAGTIGLSNPNQRFA